MRRLAALLVASLAMAACSSSGGEEADPAPFTAADTPASVVMTPDGLFAYQGWRAGFGDGFVNQAGVLDPRSGAGTATPTPPVDGDLEIPAVAAAGDQVVMVGDLCSDPQPEVERCAPSTPVGLVYDGEWRTIELPDGVGGYPVALGSTTDGQAVFQLGPAGFVAYSADTESWTSLGSRPGRSNDACLAGDALVAFHDRRLEVRPVDAAGDWQSSRPMTTAAGHLSVSCLGNQVLVHDDDLTVLALHPAAAAGGWTAPAAPPPDAGSFLASFWTGRELVLLDLVDATSLAYDPAANHWRTLRGTPRYQSGSYVVADGAIVGFGNGGRFVRYPLN